MRIHLLCEGNPETSDSWSGISRSVLLGLRAAGHQVDWTDVDLRGPAKALAAIATFALDRRRWWSMYHLAGLPFAMRSARARAGLARAPRPDVVLQIGATFQIQDPGVPIVLYCDSNIRVAERARATGYGEAVALRPSDVASITRREQEVYDAATSIVTLSRMVARSFTEDFGKAPERVHPIHGGANVTITIPEHALEAARTRRARGGDPTVLFVGRQFHRKGGDLLVRAFRRVRSIVPNARLVIVGPEQVPELLEPVEGVQNLGFLPQDDPRSHEHLRNAYLEADVFCLPTRFEPFGIVFLEAMQYALPCVGPAAWAVPEIIDHGETGLLTPPEDEQALADALVQLLCDPVRRQEMGWAARARAMEYFTWPATVARLERVLEGVVQTA